MSSTAIVGGRGFRIDARQTSGEAHLEDAKDRRQSSGGMANELVGRRDLSSYARGPWAGARVQIPPTKT